MDEVGQVVIRRARADESGAAADVWLRARRAAVPAIPPPVHDDADVHRWFAEVVLPARETWVAEQAGEVVAVMVLEPGWLDQLYVAPGWTGCGIGSRLVEVAKRHAPEVLDLWAFESNAGARRFYERHGFRAIARTDGDNEEGAPDVRYRWTPGG